MNATTDLRKLMDEGVFRPSSFPMLEACIHFDGTKEREPDQYRSRGTNWHAELSKVLSGKKKVYRVRDKELRERIRWVQTELQARKIAIDGVDIEAVLLDEHGIRITVGHADAEGLTEGVLAVVDFKTGDKRDYGAQFIGYAMSRMDARDQGMCYVVTFYLDLGVVESTLILFEEASAYVHELRGRWLNRAQEEPQECDYCGWCAKRPTCPVWNQPAQKVMKTVELYDEQSGYWEAIKTDPIVLGAFYTAYKKLVKLVTEDHKISAVIFDYLQSGVEVPGFHIGGKTLPDTVTPAQVDKLELLRHVLPEIGPKAFAECITGIDLPAMLKAWEFYNEPEHNAEPFPVEVIPEKRIPGKKIQFAVANGPPGRGKAAMARKARQEVL